MVQEKKAGEKSELPRQLSLDIWGNAYARGVTGGAQRILRVLDEIGDKPDIKDFSSYSGYLEADERYQRELKRRLDYELREKPPQKAEEAAIRGTDLSWERTRRMVFERDKGICKVCGKKLDWEKYECGHIVDRSKGGSDRLSNLVAMCLQCNAKKPKHTSKAEYDDWVEEGGPARDISEEPPVTTSAPRSHAKRRIRARVERGLPTSNWPHGYRAVRDESGKTISGEVVPGEVEAVRLATKLFLAGKAYNRIATALSDSPFRPRGGGRWTYQSVRKMLLSDVYAGYVHCGEHRSSGPSDKFPALWDEETHRDVRRERARCKQGGSPPASPASGVVFCRRCGRPMGSAMCKHVRRPYRYFRCSTYGRQKPTGVTCHSNVVKEHAVLEVLEAAIEMELRREGGVDAVLERAVPVRGPLEERIAEVQAGVARVEAKQDRLVRLAAEGALDEASVRRVTAELSEERGAALAALAKTQAALALPPDPEEMRARLEEVARHPLRALPMEEARMLLQRAGVRVWVEGREVVQIDFCSV